MKKIALLLIPLVLILAACGGSASISPQAQVVLDYLQAKVDGDAEKLKATLCAANEGNAKKEAASFASLDAKLDNVQCTYDEANGSVACTGGIVATYNGENRTIEPGNYSVVQEDGQWRVCGEAN